MPTTIDSEARQVIDDRLRRARAPHLPTRRRRTTFARQLRRLADRLEN